MTDTIYAPATASGRAAVAIMRVSGPESARVLESMTGGLPRPRHASVRSLRGLQGELLDRALVLWMPGPASFTGEDSAEFHIHGGSAVLGAVAQALNDHGLRLAEPGEFSRRAFANGKLDLLQAEAVADLVDAETAAQRRQALAQMAGRVGRRFEVWRVQLIEALALLEAENDFPDEDLPGTLSARAVKRLSTVRQELEAALRTGARGRSVREGYRVALIGAPNAGKSSLFNRLIGRDAAIVSPRPGTTRDVVEAPILIAGHAVTLADTAGLRETNDEVEFEGVRRARAWAERAAVRLVVVDASAPATAYADFAQPEDLLVLSKADLTAAPSAQLQRIRPENRLLTIQSSAVTPDGVAGVLAWLEARVSRDLDSTEPPLATRARHEEALRAATEGIGRAEHIAVLAPERAVEDVRSAIRALRSVVGEVDRESVLDQVFSAFCIGK